MMIWLLELWLKVPVNNFSVMLGLVLFQPSTESLVNGNLITKTCPCNIQRFLKL